MACIRANPLSALPAEAVEEEVFPQRPRPFFSFPDNLTAWDLFNSGGVTTLLSLILPAALGLLAALFKIESAKRGVKNDALVQQNAGLQSEVKNVTEDKETSDEAAQAADRTISNLGQADDEIEEVLGRARAGGGDQRENARRLVVSAREFIEDKIKSDTDGRHQRTYAKIQRYDYAIVATALFERKQLTSDQYNALLRIMAVWKRYEKGRAASKDVPEEVFSYIEENFALLKG